MSPLSERAAPSMGAGWGLLPVPADFPGKALLPSPASAGLPLPAPRQPRAKPRWAAWQRPRRLALGTDRPKAFQEAGCLFWQEDSAESREMAQIKRWHVWAGRKATQPAPQLWQGRENNEIHAAPY